MGKITALILVFLLSLSPVFSEVALGEPQQAQRNYWATEAECLACGRSMVLPGAP